MSRKNQPFWCCGLGAFFAVVLIIVSGFYVINRKSKERVDVLKHVSVFTAPSLAPSLFSELRRIADKNNCGTEGVLKLRLGEAWNEMFSRGKATREERNAVVEFEYALENLSDAMEKIGSIPDLRNRIKL